jgi:beta-carotene 3-hydroxylase
MKVLMAAAAAFVLMEAFSWLIHKYLMHGPLWNIHKTHHRKQPGFFEFNDLFSLFFAFLAVVLLLIGLNKPEPILTGLGLGISLYGLVYFIVHDMLIHRRLKLGIRLKHPYLKALAEAHRMHHKNHQREGGESFGLLLVNLKYFRKSYSREHVFHQRP